MKKVLACVVICSLSACGGGGSGSTPPPTQPPPSQAAANLILKAKFSDTDTRVGFVAGALDVVQSQVVDAENRPSHFEVDLYNRAGDLLQANWFTSTDAELNQLNISARAIASEAFKLRIYGANPQGRSQAYVDIQLMDSKANVLMTGPGGNELTPWQYDGVQRDKIAIYRDNSGNCVFDNGLVRVIDMDNQTEEDKDSFSFACGTTPHNLQRPVLFSDQPEDIWTYSVLNDAMHYGNLSYRHLFDLLDEPPLTTQVLIRVHYGRDSFVSPAAFWDGEYANFTEGYAGVHPSAVSLDIVAHEIAHGVLNRYIPSWGDFGKNYSRDVQTAHEAFADITAFAVKYKASGEKQWRHGDESKLRERDLNRIVTEDGAVESYLDYDDAGPNQYLGIGLLSYPFSLLAESRGVEASYRLFVDAAKSCWREDHTLEDMAMCIKTTSEQQGQNSDDIVSAFKAVKIKLFEQGVLSHFESEAFKLRVEFDDDSRSTGQTTSWTWDFGDGNTSNLANPTHHYANAGEYTATLTVSDSNNDSDSFSRKIVVDDQYCAPYSTSINVAQISSLVIDGNTINYVQGQHDYSQNTIALSDKTQVSLVVNGVNNSEDSGFTWIVWLDANDNGVFENTEEIKREETANGANYSWTTNLDLSAIDANQVRYIRISGKDINTDPCIQYQDQVADLKLQ